ncbi:MAG: hypothetical protein QOC77_2517, partial [Thermoleophilaceae bacterium]|nr:hypothetical protein [Thermoleophilaceae bacterium]
LTKNVGPGGCIGGGVTINGKCRAFTGSGNRTLWIAINTVASIGILWVMQGRTGKTPGKAMMGIQVVNAEGRPPGVLRAFLRYILLIVDEFPYILPMLTGFIVALNSERNQRVGDMAAGTFVVDKNAAGSPAGQVAPGAPPGQYGAPPSGPPVASSAPPPGAGGGQKADWYPDPQGQARLRYWDGQRWTDHTSA